MSGYRQQNNFNDPLYYQDWYTQAAGMEFLATWGDLPLFKGDIKHLEFCRVQTIWLNGDLDDMQGRRRSVESLARSVLSPTDVPDTELSKWWSLFGTESISPKIADAICTLYNQSPYREFSVDAGMQSAFTELYDQFEVNHAIKDAYRSALFTNVVLLIPDWETKKIRVLTPDYFRLVGDQTVEEVWIAEGSGGWREKEFCVWSAEEIKTVYHDGKLKRSEPNPYDRIPAVLLKLNRSKDLYGAGVTEAAEIATWSNFIKFLSTRVGTFQSFSVGLGVNLELKAGTRIGPGFILNNEMKMGDGVPAPSLEYVTPDGKFIDLEKYRQSVIRSFQRNEGLPAYSVDEGTGVAPTGIALQVTERTLNDKRESHSHALIKAEKDLVSLIALLALHEGKRTLTADNFSVQYADVQAFNDPAVELTYDISLKGEGLLSPSAYVLKYTNQRMTDEQAVEFLNKNKAYFSNSTTTTV